MMTGNEWLPTWLRIVATAAYVVVLVVHLHHLLGNTRRGRGWHSGHLLMALGMIVMFLPTGRMIVSAAVGEAVFAVAAVGFGAFAAAELVRRGRADAIWLFAAVDLRRWRTCSRWLRPASGG